MPAHRDLDLFQELAEPGLRLGVLQDPALRRTAPLLAAEVGADPRVTFAELDRMMREHLEHLADMPLGSSGDGA